MNLPLRRHFQRPSRSRRPLDARPRHGDGRRRHDGGRLPDHDGCVRGSGARGEGPCVGRAGRGAATGLGVTPEPTNEGVPFRSAFPLSPRAQSSSRDRADIIVIVIAFSNLLFYWCARTGNRAARGGSEFGFGTAGARRRAARSLAACTRSHARGAGQGPLRTSLLRVDCGGGEGVGEETCREGGQHRAR